MTTETKIDLDTLLAPFSLDYVYLPGSVERKGEDGKRDWSLKYIVHVFYKQKLIVTTEYSMGAAHIPGWNLFGFQGPKTIHDMTILDTVLKTGKHHIVKGMGGPTLSMQPLPIGPVLKDVMYCLVNDGDAINYTSFEDWADNYGYEKDSRKAEKIYQACLKVGLTLRNELGEPLLQELREAFQDY